jgi:putative endonuclease
MMPEAEDSPKYSEADVMRAAGPAAPSCWFLYLVECSDGSLYTGIARDVAARYAAHAKGKGARYTRSHPPRRLLAVVRYEDRSSALRAEYAMKRLNRADKRRFCLRREGVWQLRA